MLRESISHAKYVAFSFNANHHTWLPLFTRVMDAHENTQDVMKMMASSTIYTHHGYTWEHSQHPEGYEDDGIHYYGRHAEDIG